MNRNEDRIPVGITATILTPVLLVLMSGPAHAYIGPGAGFALVTSFLVVFGAIGLAGLYLALKEFIFKKPDE